MQCNAHVHGAIGRRESTHWNSGNSASKSTASTPTNSRFSSTIEARSWSVASSKPRKSVAVLGGMAAAEQSGDLGAAAKFLRDGNQEESVSVVVVVVAVVDSGRGGKERKQISRITKGRASQGCWRVHHHHPCLRLRYALFGPFEPHGRHFPTVSPHINSLLTAHFEGVALDQRPPTPTLRGTATTHGTGEQQLPLNEHVIIAIDRQWSKGCQPHIAHDVDACFGYIKQRRSATSPIHFSPRTIMADKLTEGQDVSYVHPFPPFLPLKDSRCVTLRRWKWGNGNPSGKVAEIVTEGKAEVTSNKVRDCTSVATTCV